MKPIQIPWTRAVAGLCLAFALNAVAEDSSVIRLPLQNTGVDDDASGTVRSVLNPFRSTFTLQFAQLTPGDAYTISVGGIPEASFMADSKGRARVVFANPLKSGAKLLDFDPRGKALAVGQGTNVVLRSVVSGPDEPAEIAVKETAEFRAGDGSSGMARSTYRTLRNGQRRFDLSIANVPSGEWTVYVDGIERGEIEVRGRSGRLSFDDNPGTSSSDLTFDPRGSVVDLALGTNVVFSGRVAARGRGANFDLPSVRGAFIPPTGVDADGTARTRWRIESDATRKLSVELEDVPVGSYALFANGVLQGNITVVPTLNGTEGEIEFSNRPDDDDDELPLTFDPPTSEFLVMLGDTPYFQGYVTNSTGSFTNSGPLRLREAMSSTGFDADASGDADLEIDDQGRRDFSVEIEDVPVGSYDVWIGGVRRGTIVAQLVGDQVEGEIEFTSDDDDGDELPLDFEPRGQLIEVRAGAAVYFAHVFGTGDTNATTVAPMEIDLPLFNVGAGNSATARAEFKRDDRNRRSFEVEIEDASAGAYTLFVGGVQRGIVLVSEVESGTWGQIEFETEPEIGEFLLDFDPLGQAVTIQRGGVTVFERLFPTQN